MVDRKKLPFQVGVDLSYLTEEEQSRLSLRLETLSSSVSLWQGRALKAQSGNLSEEMMKEILGEGAQKQKKTSFSLDTGKYFPENTSKKEMERVISMLLSQWKEEQGSGKQT